MWSRRSFLSPLVSSPIGSPSILSHRPEPAPAQVSQPFRRELLPVPLLTGFCNQTHESPILSIATAFQHGCMDTPSQNPPRGSIDIPAANVAQVDQHLSLMH